MNQTKKPKTLEAQLKVKLAYILSPECEAAVRQLFNEHQQKKMIVAEWDILKTLKVSETDYQKLRGALKNPNLSVKARDRINQILDKISEYADSIKLVNEKIIVSGAYVKKTAMAFLLNKKQDEVRDNITINVNIEGTDPLTLKRLLLDEAPQLPTPTTNESPPERRVAKGRRND